MKRLEFTRGYDFTCWMQQNEVMNNPTNIDREKWKKKIENAMCKTLKEYKNKCAQKAGFEDDAEKLRVWRRETGRSGILLNTNEDCAPHIGCIIGEDKIGEPILYMMFENVEKKKPNNPGYEFICKNPRRECLDRYIQFKLERNKEYKINMKTAHFLGEYWSYDIGHNNIADYFMMIGLGKTGDVPQFILLIHKNDIVRNRQFWMRSSIMIHQTHLYHLSKYKLKHELENFIRGL